MTNPQAAVSVPNRGWNVAGSRTVVRNGIAGIEYPGFSARAPSCSATTYCTPASPVAARNCSVKSKTGTGALHGLGRHDQMVASCRPMTSGRAVAASCASRPTRASKSVAATCSHMNCAAAGMSGRRFRAMPTSAPR